MKSSFYDAGMCSYLKNIPPRCLLMLVSLASAAILGVALVAQYGFNLHPCELCMAQRYPYAVIVALGILSTLLTNSSKIARYVLIICVLLLLADAGIAIYHAGVELNIFPAPDACKSGGASGETLEELRAEIMNAPLVPCNQAMAHFLGLSMAAWNALAALFLAAGTAITLRKTRHLGAN